MFRTLTRGAGLCLLTAVAGAQAVSPKAGRLHAPVRDAGTLHLASGEWSPPARRASQPSPLGATIFNNDAPQPFFLNLGPKQKVADFGRIPAGTPSTPLVGSVEGQTVHGFQFAYTTREVRGEFGYVVTFYDNYAACDDPRGKPIAARIRLMDLPGAPRRGMQASWKVTVDLRHSAYEFILGRDGEGGGAEGRFGWSIVNTSNANGPGGPILAGDPFGQFGPAAQAGQGTDWHGDRGMRGTGLGTEDAFWVKDWAKPGREGCVTEIPSAPITYGSFHLQLYADSTQALSGGTNIGTNFCDGSTIPTLFEDDFESGGLIAGGWTLSASGNGGLVQVQGGAARRGQWGARCRGTASMTRAVSTAGFDNVTLRYARRVLYMEAGELLFVEWYDGSTWHLVESTVEFDYTDVEFDLPAAAGNNPAFKIRFRTNADLTHERGDIDDIELLVSNDMGHIEAFGSTSVADNDLTLVATGVPVGSYGLFFFGDTAVHLPLGNGVRCAGGDRPRRLMPPLQADITGTATRIVKLNQEPASSSITHLVPITMNFQYWHRDGGGHNLTDALRIHFVD